MSSTLTKSLTTPEGLLSIVPRTVLENIQFRQELHTYLAKDTNAQKVFLEFCRRKPQIAYDTCLWTFAIKNKPGLRNYPFILRPAQIEVVDSLTDAIENGHDLLIDKSRDEGATEIITKLFSVWATVWKESLL